MGVAPPTTHGDTIAGAMTPTCPDESRRDVMPTWNLFGFNPLMVSLRLDELAGRDIADDPMLLELIASLPIIGTDGASTMGHPSPVRAVVACSEDEAARLFSSPERSCGSPHGDGPTMDLFGG